jgi:hypothetical protein
MISQGSFRLRCDGKDLEFNIQGCNPSAVTQKRRLRVQQDVTGRRRVAYSSASSIQFVAFAKQSQFCRPNMLRVSEFGVGRDLHHFWYGTALDMATNQYIRTYT